MSPPLALALVAPDLRWQQSFLSGMREFRAEGLPWWSGGDAELALQDFPGYVAKRRADATRPGETLVPATHLWAIADDTFVGRISIRHELTEALARVGGHVGYDTVPSFRGRGVATQMLAQALPVARRLGLPAILLTCDESNGASRRVIERNGGVLHETRQLEANRAPKRYYWIRL